MGKLLQESGPDVKETFEYGLTAGSRRYSPVININTSGIDGFNVVYFLESKAFMSRVLNE
jgi:hypothetical protein